MADDQAVAIGNDGANNGVAVFWGNGGGRERTQVEKDHDVGSRKELGQELDEDGRGHITGFIEEDAEACGWD